jgi:hypothetical protein
MAKQSKGRKRTVGRVMHEFKHGELKRGRGGKVKSRRQAIAIALHEAGASRIATAAKNRANFRKTKAKERRGETASSGDRGATRADLMRKAQKRKVPGRSRMSKAELQRALQG